MTIGLTLSGGGARGAAHIGLLRALLEEGIVPNRLVGVSAGAIVATQYAAGLTPDDMMDVLADASLFRLVRVGIPITGLTTLDYLKEKVAEILPDNSFEGLRYPLYIGITNLNTGMQELRNSGPLHDILAASCSIPFVFKPVIIDGAHYVDGGVIQNMPVTPLLHEADFIIGSNLMPYGLLPPADVGSVVNIVWRCFDLSIMANTLPSTELCDIVIEPSMLNSYNIFSINKLRELHDLGYAHTRERMPAILQALEMKRDLLNSL
ncbi:patatin-like phospholipase family protein [Neolewinella lacunae]|uniref:Patatin-like phospholipase family protein n=1 Tax=Neolewinella lacunae TaxID=1517758 RepID=A0A923PHB2_9BACT|nr:patatin-like phospholipase family protein [Neolewinella lacunae]MBC6994065.1 patatin-like phospholipase family protein [Neolewinella lacunae]MDN3636064.1 patatin-like phospholipase family protein [Neolewinella lacunae]